MHVCIPADVCIPDVCVSMCIHFVCLNMCAYLQTHPRHHLQVPPISIRMCVRERERERDRERGIGGGRERVGARMGVGEWVGLVCVWWKRGGMEGEA